LALLVMALGASGAQAQSHPRWYVRGALGIESARDTVVRDRDCRATTPPALFGCGLGADGRALGARGALGDPSLLEGALGLELGSRSRLELALQHRSDLDLAAQANFRGVAGAQPVTAEGSSRAALAIASVDLGPEVWRLRPFLSGGLGIAHNETGDVLYGFPAIAPGALTRVVGGSHTDFAWSCAAGASWRLSAATHLDLALRYADLGVLRTDDGGATIVRPTRALELAIAGTRARIETYGVSLSLRHRF
jgi:opacity protein-like surface antigen